MSESVHGIFLRLEAYALFAASRKAGGNTLLKVAAEAMRMAGYCDHVESPLEPSLIYGVSPLLLVNEHEARSSKAVSRYFHKPSDTYRTRRQRKDRPVVIAGIISVPDNWDETEPRWQLFKDASVNWLIVYFGSRHLHGVIEHVDERCLHLHFFLSPLVDESIMHIHPGFKAVCALGDGATPRQKKSAFESAMRTMLDQFHEQVGQQFGLVRKHIGAKRMSRRNWHIWNWYRQRAHSQKERLAEAIGRGMDQAVLVGNRQPPYHNESFCQSMSTDLILTGPDIQSVDAFENKMGVSHPNDVAFIVTSKKNRSVTFDLPDLMDCEPISNYSWVRPRSA